MSQKSILSFFKGQGQGSISQTVIDIIREVMNWVNKEIELKKSSKNEKKNKETLWFKSSESNRKGLVGKISMVRHSVERR